MHCIMIVVVLLLVVVMAMRTCLGLVVGQVVAALAKGGLQLGLVTELVLVVYPWVSGGEEGERVRFTHQNKRVVEELTLAPLYDKSQCRLIGIDGMEKA